MTALGLELACVADAPAERWGQWRYCARTRHLSILVRPDYEYLIPLRNAQSPRSVLGWLSHVAAKTWAAPHVCDLVRAFTELGHHRLCGKGWI